MSKFNVWVRIEQEYTDKSTETMVEELATQVEDMDDAIKLKDELIEHACQVDL